jgi:hypothetical protein
MAILKPSDIDKLADQLKELAKDIREDRRIKMNDALASLITQAMLVAGYADIPELSFNSTMVYGKIRNLRKAVDEYNKVVMG